MDLFNYIVRVIFYHHDGGGGDDNDDSVGAKHTTLTTLGRVSCDGVLRFRAGPYPRMVPFQRL